MPWRLPAGRTSAGLWRSRCGTSPWLERRWPGAGHEDWDGILGELAERGYDAVRIDPYPHLLARAPDREWTLLPCWNQQDWGSPAPTRALRAPAKTGAGQAPTAAPRGTFTRKGPGSHALVGGGADVGDPSANCVFAGSASTYGRSRTRAGEPVALRFDRTTDGERGRWGPDHTGPERSPRNWVRRPTGSARSVTR